MDEDEGDRPERELTADEWDEACDQMRLVREAIVRPKHPFSASGQRREQQVLY